MVVPPPKEWHVTPQDNELGSFSHLNLDIQKLATSDRNGLEGIMGVTARGQQPRGTPRYGRRARLSGIGRPFLRCQP
eukprot:1829402-Ditylum_brightwellii.AAC.1